MNFATFGMTCNDLSILGPQRAQRLKPPLFAPRNAETFVPNAPALFAYAERAAVLGGAQLLVVLESEDFPAKSLRHSNLSSFFECHTKGRFLKMVDPAIFPVGFNPKRVDWIAGGTPMA